MRNIEQDRPSSDMFSLRLYEVIVDSMEGERECLQVDQDTHDDVYSVDGLATRAQDEGPDGGAHQEYQRHHAV